MAKENYLAQGVAEGNQEGLGTGLAYKISAKWPEVQKQFKKHARSGKFRGGNIWVCKPENDRLGFVYLATQPDMYHATMPYLRKAIKRMAEWAEKNNAGSIALPKIAAGLGKLSWTNDVKPMLIQYLEESSCSFVVYEVYTHAISDGSQ
ncbi:MAG: macro domain-containing protein [Litoreibacter sp.]